MTLSLAAVASGSAFGAKGHCNISADKKWIEKTTKLYTASEDPNVTIHGVTHKQFNELVKSDKEHLSQQRRTIPQDMSRCGNALRDTGNIDGSGTRDTLKKLRDVDESLNQPGNLTCLCDNDTKRNRSGAEDPMTAQVAPPPNFADPANPPPHVNPPQTSPPPPPGTSYLPPEQTQPPPPPVTTFPPGTPPAAIQQFCFMNPGNARCQH